MEEKKWLENSFKKIIEYNQSRQEELSNIIIEGLKRKGFEFENDLEIENFIKTRCSVIENLVFKYFVCMIDEKAFLIFRYELLNPNIFHSFSSYSYV